MTEVAAVAETGLMEQPEGGDSNEERSLASDAWRTMRRNPLFWVAMSLITIFVLMAIWPSLFTSTNPTDAILAKSRERPNADAWFGRDIQGYDIYARCVYGARASILVGVMCTLGTVLIGGTIGVISGYQGGWADSLLSRIGDVFFAIPLLLGGAIVTERIFNIPGIGGYIYNSIRARDGASVVGAVTVLVIVYLFVNLLVDLLYGLLDPRISHD